jgi:hypothetical protein
MIWFPFGFWNALGQVAEKPGEINTGSTGQMRFQYFAELK